VGGRDPRWPNRGRPPYGDDCYHDTGSGNMLQRGTFRFTMTATDGTHTATATGTLDCSKLGT
jgi:hypothetical protein